MSMLDALLLKRISVDSGVEITPRRGMLNLIAGSGITLSGVDDSAGGGRTNVTIAASGGGGTGLDYLLSVRGTSTVALPAYTRVGNALTANANGAFPVTDGLTYSTTQRFLLRHGASAVDNGIYTVTNAGAAGAPWVLTRAADLDETSELSPGQIVAAEEGTAYIGSQWIVKGPGPLTINSSAINWRMLTAPISSDTGAVQTWNNATGEWISGRALTGDYTVSGSIAIGASPATLGELRLPSEGAIYGRSTNKRVARISAADNLVLGHDAQDSSTPANVLIGAATGGVVQLRVAGNVELSISDTAIDAQNNNIVTTGFLQLGATVAASGDIRGTSTFALKSRTSGGTTYGLVTALSDGAVFGDATGCAFATYRTSAGNHAFEIAGSPKVTIGPTVVEFGTSIAQFKGTIGNCAFGLAQASGSSSGNTLSMSGQQGGPTGTTNGGPLQLIGGQFGAGSGLAGSVRIGNNTSGSPFYMVESAEVVGGQRSLALFMGTTAFTSTMMPANSGDGVAYIRNAATEPTANSVGGPILWAGSSALKVRSPSGWRTTLTPEGGTAETKVASSTTVTTLGQANVTLLDIPTTTGTAGTAVAQIAARDQTNGDSAGYVWFVAWKNTAGTAAIVGTNTAAHTGEEDATWSTDVVASGANIRVRAVATDAANSVKWDVHVSMLNGST